MYKKLVEITKSIKNFYKVFIHYGDGICSSNTKGGGGKGKLKNYQIANWCENKEEI